MLALHRMIGTGGAETGLVLLTLTPVVFLAALLGGIVAAGILTGLSVGGVWLGGGGIPPAEATAFVALAMAGATLLDRLAASLRRQQALGASQDVALARQTVMQAELQHRVANSMQFAAALLAMQARKPDTPAATREGLADAGHRLGRMARLHRLLQDPAAAQLPLDAMMQAICGDILFGAGAEQLRCEVLADAVTLPPARLTSLALLLAEAVANALKHAYAGRQAGVIRVTLVRHWDMLELTVADDGPGWPADFAPERSTGLGMRVLAALASQLDGQLSIETDGGAVLKVVFPAQAGGEAPVSPAACGRPDPVTAASAPRPANARISVRQTAAFRSA